MKKYYLSELLAEEYRCWDYKKIIIQAPTGMGKTTFLVKKLLPYYQSRKKKVLVLCNRRLLRQQYLYSLVAEFDTYAEMQTVVSVNTYQALADLLANGVEPETLLLGYDVICLDEFHFFYADSDFNGFGTYVLFQALMISGLLKTMIFLSATSACIEGFVKEILPKSERFLENKYPMSGYHLVKECLQVRKYDFTVFADYSYLQCVLAPDLETLVLEMAKSPQKSIIFIDDKDKAEKIKEILCLKGNIQAKDVKVLNADVLEARENVFLVENMTLANKLPCKILITTSVLDNGVSIKDKEVGNLAVITESKISFLQMIGRVRVEDNTQQIKLYFCPNQVEYYARREQQALELLTLISDIEGKLIGDKQQVQLMRLIWENPEDRLAQMYRTVLTLIPENCDFFSRLQVEKVCLKLRGLRLAVNQFAERKIGDIYIAEAEAHALVRQNPLFFVQKQMSWLGKNDKELVILQSTYKEEKVKEMIEDLCKIQQFDLEALKESKTMLNEKYGNMFFRDIVLKKGSFSREKFEEILNRYGLVLEVKEQDGKNLYSVRRGKVKA